LPRLATTIDARDSAGLTPLMITVNQKATNLGRNGVMNKKLDNIKQLLAVKTDVNTVAPDGSTPANDRLRWSAAGLRTATCGCAGSPKHPQQ